MTRFIVKSMVAICRTSRSSRARRQPPPRWIRSGPGCSASWPVPASAAGLAARVGIARQKVNYHLKALEAHGLVELSGERRHGGITERVLQASAASYVVSPAAVSESAADPDANADHLSAGYLVALAGRLVREVGALARRAGASGKRLPTLTIDTQIGFRSAADRAAFADDLTAAVLDLAARYHHDDGRPHRLLVAAHPLPEENP